MTVGLFSFCSPRKTTARTQRRRSKIQNEISMPEGHTASMKIWYRLCDGWHQGRQFLAF